MAEKRSETAPPARLARTRAEAWSLGAGIACAAVILAVFAAPMVAGKVYTYDDLGNLHLPLRHFYARCLADGLPFDWHPGLFCGFYIQGEGQAGMYHPLHFVVYRFLPLGAAFNVELFLSYPAALVGMYFLLRRWRLSRAAALFGGVAFAFSPYMMLHFMHMHAVATVAHLPWLLYFEVELLCGPRPRRKRAALAIVLLTASQALLGIPHFVLLSLVTEAFYAFVAWPKKTRLLGTLAAAKIAGALLGAVQVLPTLDALSDSRRLAAPAFEAGMYSLEKSNILQLVAPYLFKGRVIAAAGEVNTQEYGAYAGAAVLILALVCLSAAGPGAPRRLGIAGLAAGVVGFLLAFGEHGPLFPLWSRLPLAAIFRASARFLLLVEVGLVTAAAAAFDGLARRDRAKVSWKALSPAAFAAAAAVFAVVLAQWGALGRFAVESAALKIAGPALLCLAAAVVAAAGRGHRLALPLIVLFAAGDLGLYGISFLRHDPPRRVAEAVPDIAAQVDPAYYRIRVVPSYTNAPTMAGYRLSNGFGSLPPRTYLDRRTIPGLRVSSVMYLAADPAMVEGDRDRAGRTWDLRRVRAPLPRVRLVSQCIAAENVNAALAEIDPAETAVADRPVALEPSAPGAARIVRDAPGEVLIDAVAPARQMLVFAERIHTGWRAEIDGAPAEIIRVYGDFMGVVVNAGEHEVRFSFRPASLWWGRLISVCGFAVIAFIAAAAALHRQNNQSSDYADYADFM